MDPNSPFEIFVRELVAMDGVDSSEITLIDSDGCPTEHFIMGPLYKAAPSGKVINHCLMNQDLGYCWFIRSFTTGLILISSII